MFDVYCPTHRSRMLLGPRRIEALTNTPDGVIINWRCYCGTGGTHSFARERRASRCGAGASRPDGGIVMGGVAQAVVPVISPPSLPGELVRELRQEVTELRVTRWVPPEVVTGAAVWFAAGPPPSTHEHNDSRSWAPR